MFYSRFLACFLACLFSPFVVHSASSELPVSAERCAIYFALTGRAEDGCEEPSVQKLGKARKLPSSGFDAGAASLKSVPEEQGYFIRFPFNSDNLTAEYKAHLARLGEVLNSPQLADSCIKLVGHADSVGGEVYNQNLSAARARVVAANLAAVSQIEMSRIATEARGESTLLPGVPGPHPLNRRVEILARERGDANCQ